MLIFEPQKREDCKDFTNHLKTPWHRYCDGDGLKQSLIELHMKNCDELIHKKLIAFVEIMFYNLG